MNSIKCVFAIAIQNIRKWQTNYRVWIIGAVIVILIHSYWEDIDKISEYLGVTPSIWIFPFLYLQYYMKLIFTLPVVMLFCDAPFIDSNQLFVAVRAKRVKLLLGEILYIIMASGIYYLFILLVSLIIGVFKGNLGMEWGKVFHTIAETGVASFLECHFVEIPKNILNYFTPIQAVWFTFIMSWITGIMIGCIMFVLSLCTRTKYVGMIFSSILVLFSCFLVTYNELLIKYSPISWNTLNNIDVGRKTNNPSFEYCITVIFTVITICIFLIVVIGRKSRIEINSE